MASKHVLLRTDDSSAKRRENRNTQPVLGAAKRMSGTYIETAAERAMLERRDQRGTSLYQVKKPDTEPREDEEEAIEQQEQPHIRKHKNHRKGDGTISGRYMRHTWMEYADQKSERRSVRVRDIKELNKSERLREILKVRSLLIEDENESEQKIPEAVTNMTNIDDLTIRFCHARELPARLSNLTSISTLTLNETHLRQMDVVCKLTSLKQLDLSNNQLKQVPVNIKNLVVLESLTLNNNQLQVLPQQLGELGNLLRLSISSNLIHHLPDTIGKLANLRQLDVSRNQLESLPDGIGQLGSLTELNVGHNKLDYMPDTLRNLRQLRFLYVQKNRLTELSDSFTDLVAIEQLHLQNNQIAKLSGCPGNVLVLLLNENQLSDVSLLWCGLRKAKTMSLRSNQIRELPSDMMACAGTLRSLYLDSNPLEFLPDSLASCQQLCHLTVSDTKVAHIPHGVLHLPRLTLLETLDSNLDEQLQSASLKGVAELRRAYDNFVPDSTSVMQLASQIRRSSSKNADNGGVVEKRSSKVLDEGGSNKRSSRAVEAVESLGGTWDNTLGRDTGAGTSLNGSATLEKKTHRRTPSKGNAIELTQQPTTLEKNTHGQTLSKGNEVELTQQPPTQKHGSDPNSNTLSRENKNKRTGSDIAAASSAGTLQPEVKRLPRTSIPESETTTQSVSALAKRLTETNNNSVAASKTPFEKPKPEAKPNIKPKPPFQAKPEVQAKPQMNTNGGVKSSFLFSRPQ